ncbi:MAG: hypothetical protein LBS75_10270 [Synergistaceae bacterium]|jgi:hypothetical protein|nr:hypothetical protein [Synergistaceae bacterium]
MMRAFWTSIIFLLFMVLPISADAVGEFEWERSGTPEGHVYAIAAESYTVSLGVADGVKGGEFFIVYYYGGDFFGEDGLPIGHYKIPVAVLKAESVSTSSSVCKVVSPSQGWVIQRGDRVMPISSASANHLKFAAFYATPEKPQVPGHNGRWIRVAPAPAPAPVPPPAPALVYPSSLPVQPEVPYPPNYWVMPYDFDVNLITDLRLARTFPISQVEVYALEIQHRQAWDMYSRKRYDAAFNSFARQAANYDGNYLSPYWAGMCALKLGNPSLAEAWFNTALGINPNYRPAMEEISKILRGGQ